MHWIYLVPVVVAFDWVYRSNQVYLERMWICFVDSNFELVFVSRNPPDSSNSNFELVLVSRNPPDSSKEICYGDLVTEIL